MLSKKHFVWLAPLLVALMIGAVAIPAATATHAGMGKSSRLNWVAPLSGGEEVPSVDTDARGLAVFQMSADGESIRYRLIVANIEDVLMAHIHVGPAGVNGPVAVWLYPDSPPPELIEGRFDGILATGEITADDLVGPLAGMTLEDLVTEMNADNTYVNVHTTANPGGEIRGQIFLAGHA